MRPFEESMDLFVVAVPDSQPAVQGGYPPERGVRIKVFAKGVADVPEKDEAGPDAIGSVRFKSPDDGPFQVLPLVDLVKVNETELELITGQADLNKGSQALLEYGPQLCVATLGADGSYFNNGQDSEFIPGFEVETVDATGCGDAFIAGLLTQIVAMARPVTDLPADQLTRALRYANAVGALTALTQGVIPALPTRDTVDQFLDQQSSS